MFDASKGGSMTLTQKNYVEQILKLQDEETVTTSETWSDFLQEE
jgi:hypothetical protein